MSVFLRRFLFDPGSEVLLEIESVNILDLEPPASISGVGTGTVIHVGEFENGPFNTVTEVSGATDLVNTFGSLGYTYGGVPGNNPCARSRNADGAITPEYWNGNGIVQLNAKRFRRLLIVRADTSVGSVQFTRQASITGVASFAYNLEPSEILSLDIGAGPVSATFTATAATVTGIGGVFPTLFVGGETLTIGYDGTPDFTVTFLAADQTALQVAARINAYAGFAFADVSGGQVRFTSIQRGQGAQVRIVSGSAGVLTALGLTAATTIGTGNVGNIDAVLFTEIKTIVQAAVAGTLVEQDSQGRLRISKVAVASSDYILVGPATTALNLGFTVGQEGSADGIANLLSTAGTYPVVSSGTLTLGVDNEPNFNVTITAADTQAVVITNINAAAGFTMASAVSATLLLLRGRMNGGQVRVVSAPAGVLTDLGFTLKTISVPPIANGTVPAGTEVTNAAGTVSFLTMQDVLINAPTSTNGIYAAHAGPYTVKVRHSLDDGTGVSALAGTIVKTIRAIDAGSFAVVNLTTLTAALTETQIDAVYLDAFNSTLDLNSPAKIANIICAARQSNQVRKQLRDNVINASATGLFGRIAPIRPPLGTTRAAAKSTIAEPGVGAYRDQRVIYCYPGANSFVPVIARRGLGGGVGFTADGNVDMGADGFLASVMSQLPPEENPGQQTSFTTGINSLETSPNAQGFTIEDYIAFKSSGICALRLDAGNAFFQSGITSVDPLVNPNLKNIARRRMADFIQDSVANRAQAFGKKLSTNLRRQAITSEIRSFMDQLLSRNNPAGQRIAGYTIDSKSGNTPDLLAQGLFRIILKVRTLASLDSIVIESTVGESVIVEEVLPQAA
jgi:hypothetical protein